MDASLTGPKIFCFGFKSSGLGCVVKAFAFNPMMGSISPEYPVADCCQKIATKRVCRYPANRKILQLKTRHFKASQEYFQLKINP